MWLVSRDTHTASANRKTTPHRLVAQIAVRARAPIGTSSMSFGLRFSKSHKRRRRRGSYVSYTKRRATWGRTIPGLMSPMIVTGAESSRAGPPRSARSPGKVGIRLATLRTKSTLPGPSATLRNTWLRGFRGAREWSRVIASCARRGISVWRSALECRDVRGRHQDCWLLVGG